MPEQDVTLKEFFSYTARTIAPEKLSSLETVRQWPGANEDIAARIGDLLDVKVSDIMVNAWNKYRVLMKYGDREKYLPNETFLVPLAEHTIRSKHQPRIEILLNDQVVGTVHFTVEVSLTVEGIVLKVGDGKVKEIRTGKCKGKGTISCEGFTLFEKETPSFALPGTISLGDGIPIAVGGK